MRSVIFLFTLPLSLTLASLVPDVEVHEVGAEITGSPDYRFGYVNQGSDMESGITVVPGSTPLNPAQRSPVKKGGDSGRSGTELDPFGDPFGDLEWGLDGKDTQTPNSNGQFVAPPTLETCETSNTFCCSDRMSGTFTQSVLDGHCLLCSKRPPVCDDVEPQDCERLTKAEPPASCCPFVAGEEVCASPTKTVLVRGLVLMRIMTRRKPTQKEFVRKFLESQPS